MDHKSLEGGGLAHVGRRCNKMGAHVPTKKVDGGDRPKTYNGVVAIVLPAVSTVVVTIYRGGDGGVPSISPPPQYRMASTFLLVYRTRSNNTAAAVDAWMRLYCRGMHTHRSSTATGTTAAAMGTPTAAWDTRHHPSAVSPHRLKTEDRSSCGTSTLSFRSTIPSPPPYCCIYAMESDSWWRYSLCPSFS